jgi:hypothetical protein
MPANHALAWLRALEDQRFALPDAAQLSSWSPTV